MCFALRVPDARESVCPSCAAAIRDPWGPFVCTRIDRSINTAITTHLMVLLVVVVLVVEPYEVVFVLR